MSPNTDRAETDRSGTRLALRGEGGELRLSLRVSPPRLLVAMGVVIVFLTVASTLAVGALAFFRWPEGSLGYEFVKLFWLDTEHNLPTLYQFVTLVVAGALMFSIAGQPWIGRSADRMRWRVLGGAFLFLALDEMLRVHETVGDTSSFHLRRGRPAHLRAGGRPHRALVVAAAAAARFPNARAAARCRGALPRVEPRASNPSASSYAGVSGKATPLYVALATLEEVLRDGGHRTARVCTPRVPRRSGGTTREMRTDPVNEAR